MVKRYTPQDVEKEQFYQMPKFLFSDNFKDLNSDARILYALLRDRHKLSLKNNWVDNGNNVYMIYTRKEMAEMLRISDKTVLKAINLLKESKLLQEIRQGINKPNILYLSHETVENTGQGEIPCQDKENLRSSKTNLNKTEKKVLHHLAETDDVYVKTYLEIMNDYNYNHKKVSDKSLSYILESISNIKELVDLDEFEEAITEYFENLPDSNDGDILPFLKASKRIFEIEPVECY